MTNTISKLFPNYLIASNINIAYL